VVPFGPPIRESGGKVQLVEQLYSKLFEMLAGIMSSHEPCMSMRDMVAAGGARKPFRAPPATGAIEASRWAVLVERASWYTIIAPLEMPVCGDKTH
jgi:hypothetical protein